jgi:hypothetical protein
MLDRLRALKLSDRLTLNSAGKEEGGGLDGPATQPSSRLHGRRWLRRAGRPEVAAGGRLAIAPAARGAQPAFGHLGLAQYRLVEDRLVVGPARSGSGISGRSTTHRMERISG